MPLQVLPVKTKRHWREFHALKNRIYRRDPGYVRPLDFQRHGQLDRRGNPFYAHAECEALICWDGDQPLGRIVAIVDRLHQEHYRDRLGFFGFFECPNDPQVCRLLVEAAADWLISRGCEQMRGPVNPSMKSDFGVLVEGNEYPPYIMMAHSPKYYHELLVGTGFEIVRTFNAYALHASDDRQSYRQHWEEYEALCQRIRDRFPQLKIRSMRKDRIEEDIRRVNELGNQVRSVGWGFVPFTDAELDHAVGQLKRILVPSLNYIAEIDDQIVGYALAMPDLNWALKQTIGPWDWIRMPQLPFWLKRTDRLRIFGLGAAPKFRHTGLAGLLIKRLFDKGGTKYRAWELSWVDSENVRSIRSIQRFIPIEVYKKYYLYQRSLTATRSKTSAAGL